MEKQPEIFQKPAALTKRYDKQVPATIEMIKQKRKNQTRLQPKLIKTDNHLFSSIKISKNGKMVVIKARFSTAC
jgi:hypothetical protein